MPEQKISNDSATGEYRKAGRKKYHVKDNRKAKGTAVLIISKGALNNNVGSILLLGLLVSAGVG